MRPPAPLGTHVGEDAHKRDDAQGKPRKWASDVHTRLSPPSARTRSYTSDGALGDWMVVRAARLCAQVSGLTHEGYLCPRSVSNPLREPVLCRAPQGFGPCDLPESAPAIGSQTFMRWPCPNRLGSLRVCRALICDRAASASRGDDPSPSGDDPAQRQPGATPGRA